MRDHFTFPVGSDVPKTQSNANKSAEWEHKCHCQWRLWSQVFGLAIASLCGNHYVAGFEPRLVPLSKALYHTCFICGQRCKWWSRWPKLTSSVISDVKPIIYILHLHACHMSSRNSSPRFEKPPQWETIIHSRRAFPSSTHMVEPYPLSHLSERSPLLRDHIRVNFRVVSQKRELFSTLLATYLRSFSSQGS